MDVPSNDILRAVIYLLPGFVTAWVYYGLTAHPRPSQFERVVQALVYTMIVQLIVAGVRSLAFRIGTHGRILGCWSTNVGTAWAIAVAFGLGLLFTRWANTDFLHRPLRRLGFTRETSLPSEWYNQFSLNKTYVVLHLVKGRRLFGWPEEWPSDPKEGHFAIAEAEWLTAMDGKVNRQPLTGVKVVLVPVTEVVWIEFVPQRRMSGGTNDGSQRTATAATADAPNTTVAIP